MKLNTEILFRELSKELSVELKGVRNPTLHLGRPEYFLEGNRSFRADHLYVLRGDRLPQRPSIERGAAILCIGDSICLPYYLEDCGVLQVDAKTDSHRLFNLLTEIYNRYDAWDERLCSILNASGSVREMVACSQDIFENPLFVLNEEFHFLARSSYTDISLPDWEKRFFRPSGGGELALPLLNAFLEHAELDTQKRGAMLINILDSSTLCVNLFRDRTYSGCLIVDYRQRGHVPSDNALAEHLARMIELALAKYAVPVGNEHNSLRRVFQDLVDGLQVDLEQQWILEGSRAKQEYVCVKIKFGSRLAQLPIGYMCSMLEKSFSDSVAFQYDGSIVAFVETGGLTEPDTAPYQVLQERLMLMDAGGSLYVGASDFFQDIYRSQLYYLQACSALDNGRLFEPGKRFYRFQDHALTELIINALGKLPIEMYYSDGFRRLVEHDVGSTVSYIETLRAYLDKNMSITKTTAILYINRSTLLERIGRIKRELGTDLKDPDERLRLEILLKAMEIQATMRTRGQN